MYWWWVSAISQGLKDNSIKISRAGKHHCKESCGVNEDPALLEGVDVLNTAGPKRWTQIWSGLKPSALRGGWDLHHSRYVGLSLYCEETRPKTQKSAETLQILFTIKQKKSFPIIYFSCWHQTHISCWTQNNLRFRSFGYDGISRWRVKVCSHQAAALCISLTLCPLRHFVMFNKYRSLINNKQLLEVPIHACKPVHQTGTQNDFLRRVFELSASFLLVMCRDGQ